MKDSGLQPLACILNTSSAPEEQWLSGTGYVPCFGRYVEQQARTATTRCLVDSLEL